jgi:hypothetical protein
MRLCVCLVASQVGSHVSAAAPVEGDARLFQLVRDAQATNPGLFKRGALTAVVKQQEAVATREYTLEFMWDGDFKYWRYSGHSEFDLPTQPLMNDSRDVHVILRPDARYVYNPAEQWARVRTGRSDVQRLLEVDPRSRWYRYEDTRQSWEWMLDPDAVDDFVSKFEVREGAPGVVVIDRYSKKGGLLRVEVSLEHAGNIVQYEIAGGPSETVRRGSYQWAQHAQGGWYLKEMRFERAPAKAPNEPTWTYHLQVLSFDPQPSIARDRFELSSLSLPPGTRVAQQDQRGKTLKKWVHGAATTDSQVSQEVLDQLSRKLRQSGFAAPEPEK